MPALSSTMTEGKIVEWLKQPGDKVGRGESVLVVESDKADMDVESFQDGYLAAVLMPAGSTAPVGETIGLIVETEAEIAAAPEGAPLPTIMRARQDVAAAATAASGPSASLPVEEAASTAQALEAAATTASAALTATVGRQPKRTGSVA